MSHFVPKAPEYNKVANLIKLALPQDFELKTGSRIEGVKYDLDQWDTLQSALMVMVLSLPEGSNIWELMEER